MRAELTEKAKKELAEKMKLEYRALQIFDLVVAEWESDPTSVQCFDLRIVREAIKINKQLKKLRWLW